MGRAVRLTGLRDDLAHFLEVDALLDELVSEAEEGPQPIRLGAFFYTTGVLICVSLSSQIPVNLFSFACHFVLKYASFGSQLQPLVEPHPSHT